MCVVDADCDGEGEQLNSVMGLVALSPSLVPTHSRRGCVSTSPLRVRTHSPTRTHIHLNTPVGADVGNVEIALRAGAALADHYKLGCTSVVADLGLVTGGL